VSEELDELIEMARTIRMRAEQGNPTSRKARDVGHPRRSYWRVRSEPAEWFLSGLPGLWCLQLFFGACSARLKSCPSQNPHGRGRPRHTGYALPYRPGMVGYN
jgi:hypothetical protein